jgi:uroporphyrinogen-III synthase
MTTEPGPLTGRRVVVTRPAEQAGPLNQLLRLAGAEVIELPMIEAVPPLDGGVELAITLAGVDVYDWLVLTSPNGARAVRAAMGRTVPAARIAAVGRATADAIGWPVELVPARHDAAALAAAFPPGPGRLLLVQGDLAPAFLGNELIRKGWQLDHVIGYRTQAVEPDPGKIEAVRNADVITFASGSAVKAFVEQLGLSAMPPLVVTLGEATVKIAQQLRVVVTASAKSNTLADLGLAVVAACRRASLGTSHDEATSDSTQLTDD